MQSQERPFDADPTEALAMTRGGLAALAALCGAARSLSEVAPSDMAYLLDLIGRRLLDVEIDIDASQRGRRAA